MVFDSHSFTKIPTDYYAAKYNAIERKEIV